MTDSSKDNSRGYCLEEYKSLREEILMILKRGYEIYFSTLALSIASIGYGIKIEDFTTSLVVILSPLLVLHFGFGLIREQVRTLRRNAAYIRIFHEGEKTQIFWETRLNELRNRRKNKKRKMRDMTVVDLLKGFPTIIDIISILCFFIAYIKIYNNGNIYFNQVILFIIVTVIFITWIFLAKRTHHQCKSLQGGGIIEQEYVEEWERQKNK